MYLKSIFLENTVLMDQLDLTLPFTEEGNPKPVIFVGENGTVEDFKRFEQIFTIIKDFLKNSRD